MKKNFSTLFVLLLLSMCSSPLWAQHVATALPETQYKNFKTEHMWDAKVKIAGTLFVGDSKYGTRRMIPITGGSFEGPKVKGVVLPGGEDWQLARPDGDTEMEARYLLKADDGTVIRVTNRALMHFPSKGEKGEPYIRSVLEMEAPNNSSYAFLNHAIFLGTLEVPAVKPGEEPYVIIGVYRVL